MNNDHLDLELLSAHLDGELTGRERARTEEHLSSCARCSATRAQLAASAGHVAALPSVEMTADEHRELRQAVLRARPDRSAPWTRRYLQWALGGGLVLVAVAAIGLAFLRTGSDRSTTEALTESAAPTAGQREFNFSSGSDVDRTVASLPEVAAGINRYRAEDARGAQGDLSASARSEDPETFSTDSAEGGHAPAPAMPDQDRASNSGTGDAGGSAAMRPTDEDSPNESSEGNAFTNQAADDCLGRVAATQSYPMVPLLAREATYQGTPAWLLVFAWSDEPDFGQTLDRWQTWLVTPQDCRNLSGPELESRALYRSFSGQT